MRGEHATAQRLAAIRSQDHDLDLGATQVDANPILAHAVRLVFVITNETPPSVPFPCTHRIHSMSLRFGILKPLLPNRRLIRMFLA
jgi:hypothetical protein